MEKKISTKTFVLLFTISIGLICLGIGSSYAVFTASDEITNPIVFTGLSYDSEVVEIVNVTVPAEETVSTTLNIGNTSGLKLNYVVWYLDEGADIELGTSSGSTSSSLANGSSTSVVVDIRNNSDESVTIQIGVMSDDDAIVLDSDMKTVPSEELEEITLSLGDYVSYTPSVESYEIDTSMTGYTGTEEQIIYPAELDLWRVLNINNDGTVDLISEYVSSTDVYFQGTTGYLNFVGYLNDLADQYKTEGITKSSRYFGYNGQTEFIVDTNPTSIFVNPELYTCSTGATCDPDPDDYENKGGGDELYETDRYQVKKVLGKSAAYKVGTSTTTAYWMASRYYYYKSSSYYGWYGSAVYAEGTLNDTIYLYRDGSFEDADCGYSLRPIVTLESGLEFIGKGTANSPMRIKTS